MYLSKIIFLIFYFIFFQILIANKEVLEFSQISNCKSNEYFDSASMSCMHCNINKNLKPSTNRLQCVCNKFSKHIGFENGYPECVFCGYNKTVTRDGRDCIPCNNTICECNTNEIQIDRGMNGTLLNVMYCFPCPNNTYPSLDRSKCLSCDDFEYEYYTNYIYLSEYYKWIYDHCLHINVLPNDLYSNITDVIKHKNQNVKDSYHFKKQIETASYLCKRKHKLSCEYLSNLCALSFYSNKIACALFVQMQTYVWLFYNKNETASLLHSKKITQKFSLSRNSNDNILNFTVATFSLHGNFKSFDTPDMPCNLLKDVQFGVNYNKKCKLTIKDLLSVEMEFISPYLTFTENKKVLMHALPVLIKNMNQNTNDISQWQLVRKFFLIDSISDYKTLRYMKSLNIIVNVQSSEAKDKIFPPLFIVEYTDITHEQISKITDITLNYKIKFVLKNNNISFIFKIIIGIFLGISISFSAIKTWNYNKQHCIYFSYIKMLFWFLIYAMGTVGTMIIVSLISLCIYIFIFYKGQTTPYIIFSDDIGENIIVVFSTTAFLFKFVEMFGFICQCWNLNIYFIDWEQPKTTFNQFKYNSSYSSLHKVHMNKCLKRKHKPLPMLTQITTTIHSLSEDSIEEVNEENKLHDLPISIWRTYYIANCWLNLQTIRKINIIIQLFTVLSIFQIIQLYPWILAIPEISTNFSDDDNNFILYYTICILMYVVIYCIQWLLYIGFFECCVTSKMQEFINLCSTVNISLLILPYNYYGFYIHGRSVHGVADIDLITLTNNLEREKNNLCACKGLLPGTAQQTFILSLTKAFRIVLTDFSKQTKVNLNSSPKTNYTSNRNWEQVFNTQIKLKQFLCKFIDHCFKDMDYIIKDQQFYEKLSNLRFSHNEEKSIFYIDNNHTFDQVLLYGNEWLIATFELSVFAFMITLLKDCILAIIITVLISIFLLLITKYNGRKILINNVPLDKTFLM